METNDIKKEMTIVIHPKTYLKNKTELDKIGCNVMTADFVKQDKMQVVKED